MRKWILTIAALTLLVASTAVAHPIWARRADQTQVQNARITEVDHMGSLIVLEDRARITVPPSAQVAMTAVRPGETVDARFTEIGDEKTLLSLRVMSQDEQAP
jgi:predicted RNA-binding protein (virulence factor B family)